MSKVHTKLQKALTTIQDRTSKQKGTSKALARSTELVFDDLFLVY